MLRVVSNPAAGEDDFNGVHAGVINLPFAGRWFGIFYLGSGVASVLQSHPHRSEPAVDNGEVAGGVPSSLLVPFKVTLRPGGGAAVFIFGNSVAGTVELPISKEKFVGLAGGVGVDAT